MPDQIWCGSAAAMKEAVTQISDPRRIKGVAVTGMGNGRTAHRRGRPLALPMISWHCPPPNRKYEWWVNKVGAEKTFSIGGNTLWRFSTALRLLWMAEHEPEVLKRTHKWLADRGLPQLYALRQGGDRLHDGLLHLLFDQRKLDWSEEILALSDIDRRLLCDAYPSGTPLAR